MERMVEMSPPVREGASSPPVREGASSPLVGVSPETFGIPNARMPEEKSSVCACSMLLGRGHPFDAFSMVLSDQMSQMLLLLPSCVAKLGWWTPVVTVIFGLLSFWTAHLVQVFYFQYYRRDDQINYDDQNENLQFANLNVSASSFVHLTNAAVTLQWDEVLSDSFQDLGKYEKLPGMLGMVFNGLCQLTRGIIQLTYAASIIYFVFGKLEKRTWTFVLASCFTIFALFPTLRKHRIFSIFSLVIATMAAVSTAAASLIHKPVQRVEHSAASSSIWSWVWVSSIVVYTFGGTPVSVETLVAIRGPDNQRKFKYWFLESTAYATVLSLLEALSSYWVFGNELSKISPAAQPCTLALLPPSHLRDAASISLLILELVAICHSLSPLFMYLNRILLHMPTCSNGIWHFCTCASVVSLVCIIAAAIPFSGSMEITSLVGSFIVSPAVYVIPAVAHMAYVTYRDIREPAGLSVFPSYMISIIQFATGLIFIAIMGGFLTSIKKVFYSHTFHRSDIWTRCYLCADLWLSPPLTPVSAPAPAPAPAPEFVHFLTNNISTSNSTCC